MSDKKFIVIAIDGGAASGKSSSARALRERFGLLHADTGSYFRAVTAEMLRQGISAQDPAAVGRAVAQLRLGTRVQGRSAEIEINGQTAREENRGGDINAAVSHFAAIPALREALKIYERGLAAVARAGGFRGLVMDGRDIGSVIFPDADLRFFLHADPAERARRRASEGLSDAVAERDRLDSSRATAPLACPAGATSIDTTQLPLEAVVEQIAAPIAARFAAE